MLPSVIAVLALLLAGCSSGTVPSASAPSAEATASPEASSSLAPTVSLPSEMPIGCDSQLVDLASLTAVPPEERVECFEDRAIAIQGVKIEPFGAGGCPGDQIPGEGWLRPCVLDGMLFAPAPGAADALLVILHPDLGLALDAVPTGVPLTVTGHFDDPAAQSCRLLVDHQEVVDPSLIDQCRQQFVATAIDGP